MSADNVTECPGCQEHSLREYRTLGIRRNDDRKVYELLIEYESHCRECDWTYTYIPKPIALATSPEITHE